MRLDPQISANAFTDVGDGALHLAGMLGIVEKEIDLCRQPAPFGKQEPDIDRHQDQCSPGTRRPSRERRGSAA